MNQTIPPEDEPLRARMRRVWRGIRAPRDSGDHKYAMLALQRLFLPSTSSLLVVALVLVGLVFWVVAPLRVTEKPDEPTSGVLPPVAKLDPPTSPDGGDSGGAAVAGGGDSREPAEPSEPGLEPDQPIDPLPVTPGEIIPVPPPAGAPHPPSLLLPTRTPDKRKEARKETGGTDEAEDAVLRALRWLKQNQQADGSWTGQEESAMTGLALLCYLGHGETLMSTEFGQTVQNGLKCLLARQQPNGKFSSDSYAHAIATYAMCEASAMTGNMAVRAAMERGLQVILDGQQSAGGFNYGYSPGPRWDTSVTGWQVQAMKAGRVAGAKNPGLAEALERTGGFLRTLAFSPLDGRFRYCGNDASAEDSGTWSMTGVGVICLQVLGRGDAPEVRAGLKALDDLACQWNRAGKNSVYGWYYVTLARFSAKGTRWASWNRQYAVQVARAQLEDGHWEGGDYGGAVYTTTFCTLMLEVYYRWALPIYLKPVQAASAVVFAPDDVPTVVQ